MRIDDAPDQTSSAQPAPLRPPGQPDVGRPAQVTPTINVRSAKAEEPSTLQREPTVVETLVGEPSRHVGGLRQFVPEALATTLPMLFPPARAGAPFLSKLWPVLARIGMAEGGYQLGRELTGQMPSWGTGAGPQTLGEFTGGVLGFALSPVFRNAFGRRTAGELAQALKSEIPAWRGYGNTAKDLYDMAHKTGPRLLSQQFEQDLQGVKGQLGSGDFVDVPVELQGMVKGLKDIVPSKLTWGTPSAPPSPTGQGHAPPATVQLLATDAIDIVSRLRGKHPGMYRSVLNSLATQLPGNLSEPFEAARTAYKWGAGFVSFAEKGGFLQGEQYNPNRAMAALDKYGKDELMSRSMDRVWNIVRGPGLLPMRGEDMTPWATHRAGAEAGGMVGGPVGRAAGGILGFMAPRQSIYRNVPRGRVGEMMGRTVPSAVAEATRLMQGTPEEPRVKFRYDPATQQFQQVGE